MRTSASPRNIPVLVSERTTSSCRPLHNSRDSVLSSNVIRVGCCTDNLLNRVTYQPLLCYVINACSLKKPNALQLLSTEVFSQDFDIAAVTETWLTKNIADADISIPGYNLYRCDRIRRKGGGVCVFVRDSLDSDVIDVPIPYALMICILCMSYCLYYWRF